MAHTLQQMRLFVVCAFLGACLFSFGTIANAASPGNKTASNGMPIIASAYRASLPPGGTMKYTIGFKNTSKHAWIPDTKKLIVVSGATKESWLHAPSWLTKTVAARITKRVESGHIGMVEFNLEAPARPGTYREQFSLAIDGASKKTAPLELVVTIAPAALQAQARPITPAVSVARSAARVSAVRLIQSGSSLTVARDAKAVFRIGFKNTGASAWSAKDALTLRSRAEKESYFADESWTSGTVISPITDTVQPGELLIVPFVIRAPRITGTFTERFTIYQGATPLNGTHADLTLTVVNPVRAQLASSATPQMIDALSGEAVAADPGAGNAAQTDSVHTVIVRPGIISDIQEKEPLIRAGLFSTQDPIVVTANKPFAVTDTTGAVVMNEAAQSTITITFDSVSQLFTVRDASATSTVPLFVRFSGSVKASDGSDDQDIVFEIQSYQHRPSWNQSLNDNLFRGVVEVRYASLTNRVWAINELRLEQYLKGIAESSNAAPYEYHKALTVAARTYAKYHINRSTKYASEGYTVRTTDADQVYRGYGAEIRLPNVSRAVAETRGVMVMYDNLLAITPYFSQSDGRTRSWEEVWAGGSKPWLISKDDPANKGLPLLGHGVGMSARGAVAMALAGRAYEEILAYYYTGIELHKRYE